MPLTKVSFVPPENLVWLQAWFDYTNIIIMRARECIVYLLFT